MSTVFSFSLKKKQEVLEISSEPSVSVSPRTGTKQDQDLTLNEAWRPIYLSKTNKQKLNKQPFPPPPKNPH